MTSASDSLLVKYFTWKTFYYSSEYWKEAQLVSYK